MATLSLTIFKAKVLKDGTHKIRIAVRHKHETCYIVTRFIVKENQFRTVQLVVYPRGRLAKITLGNLCPRHIEQDVIPPSWLRQSRQHAPADAWQYRGTPPPARGTPPP